MVVALTPNWIPQDAMTKKENQSCGNTSSTMEPISGNIFSRWVAPSICRGLQFLSNSSVIWVWYTLITPILTESPTQANVTIFTKSTLLNIQPKHNSLLPWDSNSTPKLHDKVPSPTGGALSPTFSKTFSYNNFCYNLFSKIALIIPFQVVWRNYHQSILSLFINTNTWRKL